MGSVKFDTERKTVQVVEGQPSHVIGVELLKGAINPRSTHLIMMSQAMKIVRPPAEMILDYAGQTGLKGSIQMMFGSGQRGRPTTMTWEPTASVFEGYRAWVLRQQWQEGGGRGWIGRPIDHNWVVGGAWIAEIPFREFAERLFKEHPIGKLLWKEMERDRYFSNARHVYAERGDDPRKWTDVEIVEEKFTFLDNNSYHVEYRHKKSGVYRVFKVQFGLWSGEVLVPEPDYWEIQTVSHDECGIRYPYIRARRGKATFLFERPNGAPEFNWEEAKKSVPEHSTDLPVLPEYRLPADVSGSFATFWKTEADYKEFALRYNIRAKNPFIGIHALEYNDPWHLMVTMVKGWAEVAWKEGAMKIPPVVGEIPENFEKLPPEPRSGPNHHLITEGPLKGTKVFQWGHNGKWDSHLPERFHGWVKVPKELRLSFGCSVRKEEDSTWDPRASEVTVYESSGRVCLPFR